MPTTMRPARQREGAPPVIENSGLPRMGEEEVHPEPMLGKILMMPETPAPAEGGRYVMHAGAMEPMKGYGAGGELPSQEPASPAATTAQSSESYLRMRVRVENGKMSIVDSHEVPGSAFGAGEPSRWLRLRGKRRG
jgi:hypothetical protein